MSLVETFFLGIIFLVIIGIVIATIYKLLYCILLFLHCILKPFCCWNTPMHYDLVDDIDYFFNNLYCKITLPNIKCKCRKKITKIKPVYDEVYIIFVSPDNNFQIGTVSSTVN